LIRRTRRGGDSLGHASLDHLTVDHPITLLRDRKVARRPVGWRSTAKLLSEDQAR
jgi:hypothetical protein